MTPPDETAKVYPPSADTVARAHVTADDYAAMYSASVSDPDGFWATQGKRIDLSLIHI